MANRKGNIYVKYGTTGIYLYTNTDGDILPKILQAALIRGRDRWGDTPTLTRVIFSEMIQKDVFGKNSCAISPFLCDNENGILVVDDENSRVGVFGQDGTFYNKFDYEVYVKIKNLNWRHLWNYDIQAFGVNGRKTEPYRF